MFACVLLSLSLLFTTHWRRVRAHVCETDLFEVCFVSIHYCSLSCTKLIISLPHAFVIFINICIHISISMCVCCYMLHLACCMLLAYKLATATLIFGLVSCLCCYMLAYATKYMHMFRCMYVCAQCVHNISLYKFICTRFYAIA